MSIEGIIKEAIDKNPLAMKAALEEELKNRIRLALEASDEDDMDDEDMDDEDDEDDLDENFKSGDKVSFEDEYGQMVTGKYHRDLGKNKGHIKVAGGTDISVHHSRLKKS